MNPQQPDLPQDPLPPNPPSPPTPPSGMPPSPPGQQPPSGPLPGPHSTPPSPVSQPTPAPEVGQQPPQAPLPAEPAETNDLAIAGFVLAFIFAPLGLIFSILGLKKAKKSGGSGSGLAVAGLVISIVTIVLSVLWILVVLVSAIGARESQRNNARVADVNQIAHGVNQYIYTHNAQPESWSDIKPQIGRGLVHYRSAASINPVDASGPGGNEAGAFPLAPVDPTSGNPNVFSGEVVIVWRQAACTDSNQIVAGGIREMAILYQVEGSDTPSCLEV